MEEEQLQEALRNLAVGRGLEFEEVEEKFNEILLSESVQQVDESQRKPIALAILTSKLTSIPPQVDVTGVLIGYSNITKKGTRSLYIFNKQIGKIVLRNSDDWNAPELLRAYTFKASKSQQNNVWFANRENFEYNVMGDKSFPEILDKAIKGNIYSIKSALKHIQPPSSTGFVDDTKWIGIKALVVQKNPLEKVVITTLTDVSIINNIISSMGQDLCTVDGNYINRSGITSWIPKEFEETLIVDSEVIVYGVLQRRQGDNPEVQFYGFYVEAS